MPSSFFTEEMELGVERRSLESSLTLLVFTGRCCGMGLAGEGTGLTDGGLGVT